MPCTANLYLAPEPKKLGRTGNILHTKTVSMLKLLGIYCAILLIATWKPAALWGPSSRALGCWQQEFIKISTTGLYRMYIRTHTYACACLFPYTFTCMCILSYRQIYSTICRWAYPYIHFCLSACILRVHMSMSMSMSVPMSMYYLCNCICNLDAYPGCSCKCNVYVIKQSQCICR